MHQSMRNIFNRQLIRCQFTLLFSLSLLLNSAHASDLDTDTVEAFLASLKAVQTEVVDPKAEDDFMGDGDINTDFSKMFSASVDELKEHTPTRKQVSDIVERHGFDSLEEWGRTGDRIFTAYMALNMEGQPAMDMSGMDEYMAAMDYLPEAEKENMRRMMEGARKSTEAARNAPKADIEAVRPFADEFMEFQDMQPE